MFYEIASKSFQSLVSIPFSQIVAIVVVANNLKTLQAFSPFSLSWANPIKLFTAVIYKFS